MMLAEISYHLMTTSKVEDPHAVAAITTDTAGTNYQQR